MGRLYLQHGKDLYQYPGIHPNYSLQYFIFSKLERVRLMRNYEPLFIKSGQTMLQPAFSLLVSIFQSFFYLKTMAVYCEPACQRQYHSSWLG
jgi:hypothetical protein